MLGRRIFAATAVFIAAVSTSVLPAEGAPACAWSGAPGGDWPTFGRDLMNSRLQEQEDTIGPLQAATLRKAWSFNTGGSGLGFADLNGTPIVALGCVYLNTAAGDVIALNADTGKQVWRRTVPVPAAGVGGTFVSSPVVSGGRLIALVSRLDQPYAVAFNALTGERLWTSPPLATGPGFYTNATPVVHGGMVLAGFSPPEGDATAIGGIAILDAATGTIIKRVMTLSEVDLANGFAGGGVWTAPAIDVSRGFAYYGTSNPYSKKTEHPNTNAIVKVDLNAGATFGEIVGSYKGDVEQITPEVRAAIGPVCELLGDNEALQLPVGNSLPCLQLDLDFGSAPNLFRDSSGRLLIGDLQKSGFYHTARADTMAGVWTALVGGSCAVCNAEATAWDRDGSLYAAGTPGGIMWALRADNGLHRWVTPIADVVHYQSISVANGVVYTVDSLGFLDAWHPRTGLPLLRRPVLLDSGQPAVTLSSNGISIARHTVYVAAGNSVVAYRPL